ncbi:LysR substrate-binding domain-containing protein [Colwellia sp. 12G3]|uniref:LysR substrate-binding domain-containing protein n=1 Tax=Colwellia sp. 12G3 TaxID=2058299 RepID=UPI000C323F7B|nr:LysR substrate-binding domain-containing protein [Colwellia sp. 12G3]PKI17330.1 LysR family transcriptional regulator [Colwellia sp. 12G3]
MTSSPITIEALVVLDAIEFRGSYAAAAEQLNKVPSALSYIVQKLEEQLNVTLFERQGRRSVLTPAGKHLLVEGRKVLSAMNTLSEQTQTIANGWETKISIACDSILDITPVFSVVGCFLEEHQNIEIDVQEEVMNGSWEALIEDKVDLVIGAPAPVPIQKGIRAIKIGELQQVLVVNKNHQLAQIKQPVNTLELAKFRSVVVHDSAQHEIPRTVNIIEGSRHFYVTSLNQKIAAITAGVGIGYLPKDLIQSLVENGELVIIALVDELPPQDLFIAWKITNKGKGLLRLRNLLSSHFS